MDVKVQITASIVLYRENAAVLQKTIHSFLETALIKKLYLIDNSPDDSLKKIANHPEIEYLFNGKNIGFGNAHNLVLNKIEGTSQYHLILNPDVEFESKVIPKLIEELKKDLNVSMISPKVVYPNGELQYTCRRYPTFFDLVIRTLGVFKKRISHREYRNENLTKPFYPDFIHGCFMLFRTQHFVDLKGFDKRYFLYMEDADICKRIDRHGNKKLYYPEEKIIHLHRKGSSKSLPLFFKHVASALKYFNKWGY